MEAEKYERLENSRNFVDEYDYIYDTLQSMYEYRITDKDLKKEIDGLISILMEDYQSQRDECEEFVTEEDEKEDAALISGDYLDRL